MFIWGTIYLSYLNYKNFFLISLLKIITTLGEKYLLVRSIYAALVTNTVSTYVRFILTKLKKKCSFYYILLMLLESTKMLLLRYIYDYVTRIPSYITNKNFNT